MPGAYARLPNPRTNQDADQEMRAAFDEDSDDEQDERRPLNVAGRHSTDSEHSEPDSPTTTRSPAARPAPLPGTYDFERTDYDYPPPGSPPPATRAFANDWGNSNGLIPSPPANASHGPRSRAGRFGQAVAKLLPATVAQRFGLAGSGRPSGTVGGGSQNDGVFANVTAKPARQVRVQNADGTYIVPEDAQNDHPPSYAAAQADSVPTYWDATTVHVPGGSSVPGEVIVEGLATGSLFSFLWNALISVSFQFVGFLLTYLLHTTHAARFGSRAGLGVTLIQYGFALRRAENYDSGSGEESPFGTAKEAEDYYTSHNTTMPVSDTDILNPGADLEDTIEISDSTTEWLAFFLMTVGWFILLTSLLGYWRVKRWERSILSSTPESSTPPASQPGPSRFSSSRFSNMLMLPGLAATRGGSILRQGLGLERDYQPPQDDIFYHGLDLETGPTGDDDADDEARTRPGHTQFVIDEQDPDRADRHARALVAEQRLNLDLRAAGLL